MKEHVRKMHRPAGELNISSGFLGCFDFMADADLF